MFLIFSLLSINETINTMHVDVNIKFSAVETKLYLFIV